MLNARKFAMQPDGGFAVQCVSRLWCAARPKSDCLSVDTNTRSKSIRGLTNPLESEGVVSLMLAIAVVLRLCRYAKISSTIIERVMITVIAKPLVVVAKPKYLSVHSYGHPFPRFQPLPPDRIKPPWIGSVARKPFPLTKEREIFGANDSDVASRQRNFAVRLFKWGGHERFLQNLKCASVDALTTPLYQAVA